MDVVNILIRHVSTKLVVKKEVEKKKRALALVQGLANEITMPNRREKTGRGGEGIYIYIQV